MTTTGGGNDGAIAVDELVARVREEVARKRASGFYPEAMEAELDSTFEGLGHGDAVRLALRNLEVLAEGELPAPMGSNRPGIGPVIVRAKRLFRRALHPFVDVPLQLEVQASSVLARSMLAHVEEVQEQLTAARNTIEALEARVATLERAATARPSGR